MMKLSPLLLIGFIVLTACGTDSAPKPVVIEITATPEATLQVELNPRSPTPFPTVTTQGAFPTATLPPATATPSPTATATNTLVAFPTATNTSTIEGVGSPTPFPTLTPSREGESGLPTATIVPVDGADLPVFPTATPDLTRPTNQAIIAAPADVEIIEPVAISDQAPPPESLPLVNASRMGIQVHPFVTNEAWANALGLATQLKIEWIKFQIPWDVSEPEPGQFTFQYERLVVLVQQAHLQGFKVLLSVTRAPNWTRPPEADLSLHGPPADPNALAGFVTRLIQDIRPEFMEAIEIWNEPNLIREWQGVPMSGENYMRYFEAAYNAAKAADPSVVVVTAGLAPVGDLDGTRDDRTFLREMYAAGLANFPEARLGIHPYGWANPPESRCCAETGWADAPQFFMLNTIDDYRQIMLENNDSARRVWLTEFGWGTFQGLLGDGGNATPPEAARFMERISPLQQAEYTVRAIDLLQAEDYNFIELKFLWNLNFATIENAITAQLEQAGYSLLNAGGNPRPVFFYLLNTRKFYDVPR